MVIDCEDIHILVVDDDDRLRELLQNYLSKEGFRVTSAASAEDARRKMKSFTFDLIILDIMMPGESGLDFSRSLRSRMRVPVLMLTAMGDTQARIEGLEAGADDYLSKPFEPRELVLRIHSVLRRASAHGGKEDISPLKLGRFCFDRERELLLDGETPVHLTTAEISLLKALASEPGRIMSREDLADICDAGEGERTIDVQVTRLRRKIEPDPRVPQYIQTIRARGYVLRPDR